MLKKIRFQLANRRGVQRFSSTNTFFTVSITEHIVRLKITGFRPFVPTVYGNYIAAFVNFIASEEARYITGSFLTIDGGLNA